MGVKLPVGRLRLRLRLTVLVGIAVASSGVALAQASFAQPTAAFELTTEASGRHFLGEVPRVMSSALPLDVVPTQVVARQLHRSRGLINWAHSPRHSPSEWVLRSLAPTAAAPGAEPQAALVRVRHLSGPPNLGVRLLGGAVLTTLPAVGSGVGLTVDNVGVGRPGVRRRKGLTAPRRKPATSRGQERPARVFATNRTWGLALVVDGFWRRHSEDNKSNGVLLAGNSLDASSHWLARPLLLDPSGRATLGALATLSVSPALLTSTNGVELPALTSSVGEHPSGTPWVDGAGRLVGVSTNACLRPEPGSRLDAWQSRHVTGEEASAGNFRSGSAWSRRVSLDVGGVREQTRGWRSGTSIGARGCQLRPIVLHASAVRQFVRGAAGAGDGWFGAAVLAVDDGTTRGVAVVRLGASSPLLGTGLRTWRSHGPAADVIVAVARQRVVGPTQFRSVLDRLEPGATPQLLVLRGGKLEILGWRP